MQIQYLGFQPKERGRDYSYLVIDNKSADREFTFSVSNRALAERRVRYQDVAGICYQKLQKALELETAEQPLPRRSIVSDRELDEYREKHSPAKRHASWGQVSSKNRVRASIT
ncbi:MAG: hypothetical protein ABSA41_08545 [Terriglobia bacterium]|jgi:hypothetical protein